MILLFCAGRRFAELELKIIMIQVYNYDCNLQHIIFIGGFS